MHWTTSPPFGIKNETDLFDRFHTYCQESAGRAYLLPSLSRQRITDAFNAWKEDTDRNDRNFRETGTLPDHVKCAAMLTYWLRRERPVVTIAHHNSGGMYSALEQYNIEMDFSGTIEDDYAKLSSEELKKFKFGEFNGEQFLAHRARLQTYANEYWSFDFGFRLAREYELLKRQQTTGGKQATSISVPDADFIDDFCYFLKFKSVSPHAVYFVYRSLMACP